MISKYLKEEVKPATGCTEPAAVALAVAKAAKELVGNVYSINVEVSKSIYKNGLFVLIPGTEGLKGNKIAAALGALVKAEELDINLLHHTKSEDKKKAVELIEENRVKVTCNDKIGVYVHASVQDDLNNVSECYIINSHTNVQKIKLNSKILFGSDEDFQENKTFFERNGIQDMSLEDIIKISTDINEEDVDFIFHGVDLNMDAAYYCLKQKDEFVKTPGIILNDVFDEDNIAEKIRKYSSAASFTRMLGSNVTVMSSGGSGNQGIVATIPVYLYGLYNGNTKEEIAQALALSHLLSGYVKHLVGKLAPICGVFYSAGSGAAAAISYLMNKDRDKMLDTIDTMISNTTGIICDGAKESCAFRIGLSAHETYISALMADRGLYVEMDQGFIGQSCNESIRNIQRLNLDGMKDLDNLILSILEGRG